MKNLLKGLSLSVSLGCLLSSASASQMMAVPHNEELKESHNVGSSVKLSLAALPEELQLHIISYLAKGTADQAAKDVGNFSLTCSRLHAIGEEIMQKKVLQEPQALITVTKNKKGELTSVFSPAKITHDFRQTLLALAQNKIKSKQKLHRLAELCADLDHPAEKLFRALGAENIYEYNNYKEEFQSALKAGLAANDPQALELGMILHGMNASFTLFENSRASKAEVLNFPFKPGIIFDYSMALKGTGFVKVFDILMPHLAARDCVMLGHRYDRAELLDTAQCLFEMAQQPSNKPAEKACIFNELGGLHVKRRNFEQAEKIFKQALAQDNNAVSHSNLAQVYLHKGNALKAAEHQLLAFAPKGAETDYKLGLIYEKQGRIMAAAQLYRRAVKAGIAGAKAALDNITSTDPS